MVYFESIRQIADTSASLIGVRHDDDLVTTVDELGGELIDVTLNAALVQCQFGRQLCQSVETNELTNPVAERKNH